MNAFGLLVILSYTAAAFWLAATRPERALVAIVFLIPWGALYVDIGVYVSAYQIMVLALCVSCFLRSLYSDWRPGPIAGVSVFAALILWAIVASLAQIGVIPDVALSTSGGVLRGPWMRGIVQIFMFTFTLSPALLVPMLMRRPEQAAELCRTYIKSAVIVGIIGWVQLVIWYRTGQNPMPIGFINAALGGRSLGVGDGIFSLGALPVFRMNSLSGEPRSLGGALVFAMMMIQAVAATTADVPRRKLLLVWLFLATSTLATLSTSSFLLWTIGSLIQLPAAALLGVRLRISLPRVLAIFSVIFAFFTAGVVAIESTGFPIIEIAQARTIERLDTNGAVEDFDLAIIDYFKANPQRLAGGLGLGNAHLYAMRYLDAEFQWYAYGQVFAAKTNYLRLISEVGFIGLFMMIGWIATLILKAARIVRTGALASLVAIVPIGISTTAIFFAAGFNSEFYIVAGTLAAIIGMARATARVRPWLAAAA